MISKIEILGSSSKGNGYVLHFEDGSIYQLDCGIENKNCDKVNKLFITHHHIDHDRYIKDFDCPIVEPSENPLTIDDYSSFPMFHTNNDGTPIMTNGYEIKHDGEDIIYLTDCGDRGSVKPRFPKATLLIIECNGDGFGINQGTIKLQEYGKRAVNKGGHLSNLDTINLIAYLGVNKDCKIIFVHRSTHHSSDTMYKIFDCLPNKKYVAKKGDVIYAKSGKIV